MKASFKLIRVTLVTLASAGTVIPSSVWAKGPISNHSSSGMMNHVNNSNSTMALKLKTSNVTRASNGNTGFTGIGVSKNFSTNSGSPGSGGSSLGVFSSMSSPLTQNATNSGIIIVGGKNAAMNSSPKMQPTSLLQTQELASGHDQRIGDYPIGPVQIFADHNMGSQLNASVFKSELPGIFSQSQERPQHPTDTGNSQGNGRDNEMNTKLEANVQYASQGVHIPSFAVTKVKIDSTANIKPIVDQKVQIGPKFPGPLSAAAPTPVSILARTTVPNTQNMHTMLFDIPNPLDPTGIISGVVEAGVDIISGGGGGDAAAAAGAATSGGAAGASIFGNGGPVILGGLPGTPMEVARAIGAASAGAAQAAQSTVGAGTVLAVLSGPPAAILNAEDPQTGDRHRPGGYYKGDAPYEPVDGPTGKKSQFLSTSGTPSIMDVAKNLGSPTTGASGSALNHNGISSNIFKNGMSATSVIPRSTTISSVPTQTQPAHPKDNATTRTMPKFQFPTPDSTSGGSVASDNSSASDSPLQDTSSASQATAPLLAETTGADLVLEDIKLASPATLIAGPAYIIKFRNQGTAAAGKFQVAILAAVDGTLTEDAPRAVIEIPSLAAGESEQVTLRLPQSAMKLAGPNGNRSAFTQLFVAVDLMNTVAETDETNNTAIVDRASLETTAAN